MGNIYLVKLMNNKHMQIIKNKVVILVNGKLNGQKQKKRKEQIAKQKYHHNMMKH